MKIYNAPEPIIETEGKLIFLAGTIDMGHSVNWQEQATHFFKDNVCTILNPRRADWDRRWDELENKTQFNEQVNWELDAMNRADIILMNFLAASQSPVTLLELGLQAASGKLLVCCPDGFWRSGNVQIICERYQIPFYKEYKKLLNSIRIQEKIHSARNAEECDATEV